MKYHLAVLLTAGLGSSVILKLWAGGVGGSKTYPVTVSRQSNVALSNAQVDNILKAISLIGPTNNKLNVQLLRNSSVQTFAGTSDTVSSPESFNSVISRDGTIFFVSKIEGCYTSSFCAQTDNPLWVYGDYEGCTDIATGKIVIAVSLSNTWIHEFGHRLGLHHRGDSNALMNCFVQSADVDVNLLEETTLEGGGPPREPDVCSCGSTSPAPPGGITAFVQANYIEGIPFQTARSFGPQALNVLGELLNNSDNAASWPNVVTTIGAIGDPKGLPILDNFLLRGKGTLSLEESRAKLNAIAARGMILHESATTSQVADLKNSTQTAYWSKVKWTIPFYADKAHLLQGLALHGYQAVALAASNKNKSLLQFLQNKLSRPPKTSFKPGLLGGLKDLVLREQAWRTTTESKLSYLLDLGKEIQNKGLTGYYNIRKR